MRLIHVNGGNRRAAAGGAGPGARVVRLRPGALVEQVLNFERAGAHLLYCAVYSVLAYDRMHGAIIVSERVAKS